MRLLHVTLLQQAAHFVVVLERALDPVRDLFRFDPRILKLLVFEDSRYLNLLDFLVERLLQLYAIDAHWDRLHLVARANLDRYRDHPLI